LGDSGAEQVTELCGNNRVEGKEKCDAGLGDKCCSESCQLIPPAVCRCALSHDAPCILIIG